MILPHSIAWFFGGAFLVNAIPHLASGTMGRAFQSPFAKPRGIGLSLVRPRVNFSNTCWIACSSVGKSTGLVR